MAGLTCRNQNGGSPCGTSTKAASIEAILSATRGFLRSFIAVNRNVKGNILVKVIVMLFLFLCAIASVAGYLSLDRLIAAGEVRIAEGQRRLEEGQSAVTQGKAQLDAGKLQLAEGKAEYAHAEENLLLVLADNLLNGGKGFSEGRAQIAEGDKQVAQGELAVDLGERRLDAGKLELSRGQKRLRLAEKVRFACAIGAGVFAALTVLFGFFWRRTMIRFFMRAKS